jgi:hypothetical protein
MENIYQLLIQLPYLLQGAWTSSTTLGSFGLLGFSVDAKCLTVPAGLTHLHIYETQWSSDMAYILNAEVALSSL